ncbi:transposase [Elysia marginata]|uniref:Transposase n=1 Tax=Elysia marginata TaxID=1093978 RepID=A0AAV4IED6_9GAST|nr:transposase [Elysia marginata]
MAPSGRAVSAALVLLNNLTVLQMTHDDELFRPFCQRDIGEEELSITKENSVESLKANTYSRDLCDVINGWVKVQIGCYKRFTSDDWTGAVASCQAEQSQLFLPSSQRELDTVASMFDLESGMWVDITTKDGSDFRTDGNVKVSFLPWLSSNSSNLRDVPYSMKKQIFRILEENDINSVWVGFSGNETQFQKLDGAILGGNGHRIVKYDTSQVVGGPSLCGVSDFVHLNTPKTKRDSMIWKHPSSPKTKKFKVQRSAAKVMSNVFWDAKGVILLDVLPQGD